MGSSLSVARDKEDEWYDELLLNMIKYDETLLLNAIDECDSILKKLQYVLFDNDSEILKQYNEVLNIKQVLNDLNSSTREIIINLDKLRNIEKALNGTIKEPSKFKPIKQVQSIPLDKEDERYDELFANILDTDNQFINYAIQRCNNLIAESQKIMFDYDGRIVDWYNELIEIEKTLEKSSVSYKEIIINLDKLTDIENHFETFKKSSQRAV